MIVTLSRSFFIRNDSWKRILRSTRDGFRFSERHTIHYDDMPQNKFALARYAIIDELLKKNNYVKTSTITEACKRNLGYQVSQRTIQLDMNSMKNDSFLGIFAPIEYCSKRKAYYYHDSDYEFAYQQLNPNEVNLLENACSIASRHMKPDQRIILGDVLFKIKKKYMAK